MRFCPEQHLRRTAQFAAVRTFGLGRECGPFAFQLAPNQTGLRRLGVVASKRLGNAVARNRAKRRLRALFRLHQEALPEACDLVLIARRRALFDDWAVLEQRFLLTASRLGPFLQTRLTEEHQPETSSCAS